MTHLWCGKTQDHGRGRQIEGPDLHGKRVVIVEDTSTTGGSPLTAAKWPKPEGNCRRSVRGGGPQHRGKYRY